MSALYFSRITWNRLSIALILFLIVNQEVFAQENNYPPVEIVVTASRNEQPRNEIADSITIISTDQIDRRQDVSIVDALKTQPSLDVISTGTKGASTSVSIRGANPEHTLVLLDGIELNNPILPSRSFNFADLLLNEVERIEILRGPQSTLYGSDAMGGVINIISKKGVGPLELSSAFEAGSHSSFIERISAKEGNDIYSYALSFMREDIGGISSSDVRLGNQERDPYGNSSFFARLSANLNSKNSFNTIFRAIDSFSELDNSGGLSGDDPNRKQDNQQFFLGNSINSELIEKKLKSTISFNLSDQTFDDNNDPDFRSNDYLRSKYEGKSTTITSQLEYLALQNFSLIGGVESQEERGESSLNSDGAYGPYRSDFPRISATTNAYFLQTKLDIFEQFFINSGVRLDQHSKFGSQVTYKLAPNLLLNNSNTRIFSTVGSGFKAPSLFQVYSSFGSQELDPEKVIGADFGVEQGFFDRKVVATLTYFYQDFDQLINFDPNTYVFSNIDSVVTNGLEANFNLSLGEFVSLNLGYTYLDATNNESGEALLRKPKNRVFAELDFQLSEVASLGLESNYRSSSFDNDFSSFPSRKENLSGYSTLDLTASYQLHNQVELYARLENLIDKNYQQVYGYGTYGTSGYVGVRMRY